MHRMVFANPRALCIQFNRVMGRDMRCVSDHLGQMICIGRFGAKPPCLDRATNGNIKRAARQPPDGLRLIQNRKERDGHSDPFPNRCSIQTTQVTLRFPKGHLGVHGVHRLLER